MPNFFKKLSRGANNVFKKIDSGASNFFKKLPNQVDNVVGTTKKGLNKGLDFIGDTARKVGNTLEKAAPAIGLAASMALPQFAPAIMAATTAATSLSRNIQNGARQGQGMTNQLAQTMQNKANTTIGQAQKGFANGLSNLQNQANNAIGTAQSLTIH
jgi:hypothetical protein